MIGTGQHLGATAGAVHQPRSAVTANISEGARLAVVAADDDHAFAEILEGPPLARLGDLAFVAHNLRRRAKKCHLLRLEKFRVEVEPARQAPVIKRVG